MLIHGIPLVRSVHFHVQNIFCRHQHIQSLKLIITTHCSDFLIKQIQKYISHSVHNTKVKTQPSIQLSMRVNFEKLKKWFLPKFLLLFWFIWESILNKAHTKVSVVQSIGLFFIISWSSLLKINEKRRRAWNQTWEMNDFSWLLCYQLFKWVLKHFLSKGEIYRLTVILLIEALEVIKEVKFIILRIW